MKVQVEHAASWPSRVRRESVRIGYEHTKGCASVKPIFGWYAGGIDRHLSTRQWPLTTGTSDDRTSPHADLDRIAEFEESLGEPLPATIEEHFELAFEGRDRVRGHLELLAATQPELLREMRLEPETLVKRAFSELLVVEALPYGSPMPAGEDERRRALPGA